MNLCFEIVSRRYKKRKSRPNAPVMTYRDYWNSQFESSKKLLAFFPKLDLKGKSVLDLGCGIGGRSAFLATTDAARVVAIDINHEEIDIAEDMAKTLPPDIQQKLAYHKTSEDDAGDIGQFDLVLLIDSLEHVRDPGAILALAHKYTKPGGCCYFSTMGWYHRHGSHMGILGIPWINVFFSDKTIIEATRMLLSQDYYIPTRFDSVPPAKRWEGIENLSDRPGEYLNKITIAKMYEAMESSPFDSTSLSVVGYNKKFVRLFNFLNHIPGLRELYHSYCVGRLEKSAGSV
jgi:2-polyprenyl-3-methyl-5-hydroxy-6-metoxy-1,4-benzoquinol methylase